MTKENREELERKKCNKCKKTKSLNEFHKDKRTPDSHSTFCKICQATIKKKYLKKNPWAPFMNYITCRLKNGGQSYKNRKNFLHTKDIKKLWLRDKAYAMKQPSLDRIDNNKDYTLDNCQFIELVDNIRKGSIDREFLRKMGYIHIDDLAQSGYVKKDEIECDEEKIKKILEDIKLPMKDFCPCDYTEQKGTSILIIKRRITEVISHAIATRWKELVR